MPELKFNGPATLTGFPADKAFSFDMEPNKLTIRAGKEIFAVIEKEPAVLHLPNAETLSVGSRVPAGPYIGFDALKVPAGEVLTNAEYTFKEGAAVIQQETTAPGAKTYDGTLESVIIYDPTVKVNYRTIRAKYLETLKTANGREVGWWANSAMVKALEGDPMKMLQFFIAEGVVKIDKRQASAGADAAGPILGQSAQALSFAGGQTGSGSLATPTSPANVPGGWVPPANFGSFK